MKTEFEILSEYCKGETFYYYYSPSNQILTGTFGGTDYKLDGINWIARKNEYEAKEDQRKYLEDNDLIDKGRSLNKDKFIECIELWYEKKIGEKSLRKKITEEIERKKLFLCNMQKRFIYGCLSDFQKEIETERINKVARDIELLSNTLKL